MLPHLNACKHYYAYELRGRLERGEITKEQARDELKLRSDELEIRRILKELRGKN